MYFKLIHQLVFRKVNMKLLKGHTDYINGIAFEPDTGELLISCSDDHTARLWEMSSGSILHTFYLSSPGKQESYNPPISKIMVPKFFNDVLLISYYN